MRLKLLVGANNFCQDEKLIKHIDNDSAHIFIVPDRFTMSQEKLIFETLNVESLFNVEVYTLGRLVNNFVKSQNFLPKEGSVMLIKKLLIENRKSFNCFANTLFSAGFAENIFETINQLKACKILPEQLESNDKNLKNKFEDLQLIYSLYQKAIEGKFIDSADKLTILASDLENIDFSNTNFYFSHFDGFTKQGYDIINVLIKKAKTVFVATPYSASKLNSHIYQNDVYENLLLIANSLFIKPEVEFCDSLTSGVFKHLEQFLYSFNPTEKIESDKITLFECENLSGEIEMVATTINKKVKENGERFRDNCILLPSLKTKKDEVCKILDRYEINYYFDTENSFEDTYLYRFLTDSFNLVTKNYERVYFLSFIKNAICGFLPEDVFVFDDICFKYKLSGKDIFDFKTNEESFNKILTEVKDKLFGFEALLKKSANADDFVIAINFLLKVFDVEQQINNVSINQLSSGYKLENRINQQIFEVLTSILNIIGLTLEGCKISAEDFFDILDAGLKSAKIFTVPLAIDSVFVGDSSKSIIPRYKNLYICGANSGEVPVVQQDLGLISDNEIDSLKNKILIEPSIKKINDRERFKLFCNLISPQNLFISSNLSGRQPEFIGQIKNMVTQRGQPIKVYNEFFTEFTMLERISSEKNLQTLLTQTLRNYYDGQPIEEDLDVLPYLQYLEKTGNFNLNLFKKKNEYPLSDTSLFFPKSTVSVSQIERYFSCPFKYFAESILKLQPREDFGIDSLFIGNFLHAVAENFVKDNNLPLEKEQVKTSAKNIYEKLLLSKDFYEVASLKQNKFYMQGLKNEAIELCQAINYQIDCTSFKLLGVEVVFDDKNIIKQLSIDVGKKILKISGKVDRIDVFGDFFRIIDYKTGKCDAKMERLYYGEKLQLEIYQKVVAESLKKEPAGRYYLPVQKSFAETGDYKKYQMQGSTLNNLQVLFATDKKLKTDGQSDIIKVKFKKSKGEDPEYYANSQILSREEILQQSEYAVKLLKSACEEMLSGNIEAAPLKMDGKETCQFCQYKTVCKFDELLGGRIRTADKKISKDFAGKVKYE